MRRFIAPISILIFLLTIPAALAWTVEDCEEVNYDHPDCDQYPTTTTYQTSTTVTTTPNETTTTTPFEEQTTTTGAPCTEGLIHQPPLCVNPSTTQPEVEVSSTVVTAVVLEELPMTGVPFFQLLAAASSLLLLAGMAVLSFKRRDTD